MRCTLRSATSGSAIERCLHDAGGRRLLDSRPPVLRRHEAAAAGAGVDTGATADAGGANVGRLLAALPDAGSGHQPSIRGSRLPTVSGRSSLPRRAPTGAGRPDLASGAARKGIRAQPDKWEYMEDAGFVHYWYEHNYQAAAGWFQKASEVPGAPWWLRSLAATTIAQGGDRRSSRVMWEAIRQSAAIDWLRHGRRTPSAAAQGARRRSDSLQQGVDAFVRSAGHAAGGLADARPCAGFGACRWIPQAPRTS